MSESISAKVPGILKKRFELRCSEVEQTKSEVLKRLVSEFVDGTGNRGASRELVQRFDELEQSLSKTTELLSLLSEELESRQIDMRNLVAAFFRLLVRNPSLLTDPDQFTSKEFRDVFEHLGLGDLHV